MPPKTIYHYLPTAGVRADLKRLMNEFISAKTIRYEQFSDIWRRRKFSFLCAGRHSDRETREFLERAFLIAVEFFMPPYQFQVRVGGLYLLYGIFMTQPIVPKVKVRLTVSQWEDTIQLQQEASQQNHLDVVYVFNKMLEEHAFQFCFTPTEMNERAINPETEDSEINLADEMKEERREINRLFNYESMEQMSYLLDHYHQMKVSMAGRKANKPDKSLDVVQGCMVEDLVTMLQSFKESVSNIYKHGSANVVTPVEGGTAGTSMSETQSVLSKRQAIKSRIYADVDVHSPVKKTDPGHSSSPRKGRNVSSPGKKPTVIVTSDDEENDMLATLVSPMGTRKRGRPRKQRNTDSPPCKKLVEEYVQVGDNTTDMMGSFVSPKENKRGPGRPKKYPQLNMLKEDNVQSKDKATDLAETFLSPNGAKQGLGRRKKSLVSPESKILVDMDIQTEDDATDAMESSVSPTGSKRSRGRPKKSSEDVIENFVSPMGTKRGPGRPKKIRPHFETLPGKRISDESMPVFNGNLSSRKQTHRSNSSQSADNLDTTDEDDDDVVVLSEAEVLSKYHTKPPANRKRMSFGDLPKPKPSVKTKFAYKKKEVSSHQPGKPKVIINIEGLEESETNQNFSTQTETKNVASATDNEPHSLQETFVSPKGIKRGRGRPRKSFDSPQLFESYRVKPVSNDNSTQPKSLKRGRPPGKVNGENKNDGRLSKRSSKQIAVQEGKTIVEEEQANSDFSDNSDGTSDVSSPSCKHSAQNNGKETIEIHHRGRGRPQKHFPISKPGNSRNRSSSSHDEDRTQPKREKHVEIPHRSRGRPRKSLETGGSSLFGEEVSPAKKFRTQNVKANFKNVFNGKLKVQEPSPKFLPTSTVDQEPTKQTSGVAKTTLSKILGGKSTEQTQSDTTTLKKPVKFIKIVTKNKADAKEILKSIEKQRASGEKLLSSLPSNCVKAISVENNLPGESSKGNKSSLFKSPSYTTTDSTKKGEKESSSGKSKQNASTMGYFSM